MKKINEIIEKFKAELDKLRDVEDDKVKKVISDLDGYVKSLELTEEPEVKTKEVITEEPKKDDKIEVPKEKVVKDSVEDETKKPEDEKEVVEPKKDDIEAKELSLDVSKKLQEAAIELDKSEKNLAAKEEVINVYKTQVMELEAKLKVYKDQEGIELQKGFDKKLNKLVGLYKNLGMAKDVIELGKEFTHDQIDKLIIDLSAINNVHVEKKSRRETSLSSELELNNYSSKKEKPDTDEARAQMLFGL